MSSPSLINSDYTTLDDKLKTSGQSCLQDPNVRMNGWTNSPTHSHIIPAQYMLLRGDTHFVKPQTPQDNHYLLLCTSRWFYRVVYILHGRFDECHWVRPICVGVHTFIRHHCSDVFEHGF